SLPSIVAGSKQAVPQAALGRGEPSHAPLLHKASGALDLRLTAAALSRQVRAFSPWPGTFLQRETRRLGIIRACEVAYDGQAAPGTVLQASAAGLDVACGAGAMRLLEVRPAGKKSMAGTAWLLGHRVEVGDNIAASI
ncbi:MAG: methionyl-tRNA formyltransferase, partial [Sphingobacteriales bacterium]